MDFVTKFYGLFQQGKMSILNYKCNSAFPLIAFPRSGLKQRRLVARSLGASAQGKISALGKRTGSIGNALATLQRGA